MLWPGVCTKRSTHERALVAFAVPFQRKQWAAFVEGHLLSDFFAVQTELRTEGKPATRAFGRCKTKVGKAHIVSFHVRRSLVQPDLTPQ
jgi:hypothetical protein